MRILGLDVGAKTIGVAVCDPFGWTAQGVTTIQRKGLQNDLMVLSTLIDQYQVEEIVFGLPLHMNGSEGDSAQRARKLAQDVQEYYGQSMKITLWDERLSTAAAQRI